MSLPLWPSFRSQPQEAIRTTQPLAVSGDLLLVSLTLICRKYDDMAAFSIIHYELEGDLSCDSPNSPRKRAEKPSPISFPVVPTG